MGKQKNAKPNANLKAAGDAGAAGGTEDLGATDGTGPGAEKPVASPADATTEAGIPASGRSDAADADPAAAVPGAAVATGEETQAEGVSDEQAQETEKESAEGAVAQGSGDHDLAGSKGASVSGVEESGGRAVRAIFDDAAGENAEATASDDGLGDGDGIHDGRDQNAASGTIHQQLTVGELARSIAACGYFYAKVDSAELFTQDEAAIMADFVRDNPDAPLLAMLKHLEITMRYPVVVPNHADMLSLSLFRHACLAAFEFERCQAADEKPPQYAYGGSRWPGEQALQVQDNAFSPSGFAAR